MVKRIAVALLVVVTAVGWYLYRQATQKIDRLQHEDITRAGAIQSLTRQFSNGLYSGTDSAGRVLLRVPSEIRTGTGTSIVYKETAYTPTRATEYQRYDGAKGYVPVTLSDFKPNAQIVFNADPAGTLILLYLIQ